MKIRPVGTELLHLDGRKDVTKPIVAFRKFCERANKSNDVPTDGVINSM